MEKFDEKYFNDKAIETGKILGCKYWILKYPRSDNLNGYASVPIRLEHLGEYGHEGIMVFVPVHGGITFIQGNENETVYGFDTGHYNSHEYPIHCKVWIRDQIKAMIEGLHRAKEVDEEYNLTKCCERKSKLMEYVAGDASIDDMGIIGIFCETIKASQDCEPCDEMESKEQTERRGR